MINKDVVKKLISDNKKTIEAFCADLTQYYCGRATPALLDRVKVKYYGELVPIEMCASISVQQGQMLLIKPYDLKMAKDIERAIHQANIGLNPKADSDSVRVYLPNRTKEDDEL